MGAPSPLKARMPSIQHSRSVAPTEQQGRRVDLDVDLARKRMLPTIDSYVDLLPMAMVATVDFELYVA